MRVLIIEPHSSGHHANYLRWLVQTAARKEWKVVIASTLGALSHPQLNTAISHLKNVDVHRIVDSAGNDVEFSEVTNLVARQLAYWRMLHIVVRDVRNKWPADAVVLPYIDYCLYAIALLGAPFKGMPWCGISMRLSMDRNDGGGIPRFPFKWRLVRRILAQPNLRSLFVINPSVADVPAAWYPNKLRSKLTYLPDPAEFNTQISHSEARTTLGIGDGAYVVLVFGTIDERKGVDALTTALVLCEELSNCVLIVAGKQSASMRNQMRQPLYNRFRSLRRLIELDRVLTDAEQTTVFRAADVVWVGYRHHVFMSGVMVLAGKAGLPLLGCTEGEIGQFISKNDLGAIVNIDRPTEVATALLRLCDKETRLQAGQRALQTFAGHSVDNFGMSVLSVFDDEK
jgi:glycosyltransferase involved in cell wall biosynthesis